MDQLQLEAGCLAEEEVIANQRPDDTHSSCTQSEDIYVSWIPHDEGRKDDSAKADLSLCPRPALELMARAFMYGEKKYGRLNYAKGLDPMRCAAAALRHITEYVEAIDRAAAGLAPTDANPFDAESGVNHIGHALASLAMLVVNTTPVQPLQIQDKSYE